MSLEKNMIVNRFILWLLKQKYRFMKKPRKYCRRCLKDLSNEEEYYSDFELETSEIDYICKECNKFFEEQIKERDRQFQEKCPLHKTCCLYCETCEDRNCDYGKQ